jgi:hypothetical protein
MATCKDISAFLDGVSRRSVPGTLSENDVQALQQIGLVQVLTREELQTLTQQVETFQQAQAELTQEATQRNSLSTAVQVDTRKTHSILFHLEGVDRQHSTLERLQQEQQAYKNVTEDIAKRQQALSQLLVKKALVDSSCPYNGRYVSLTTAGRIALRDLTVRLYRVADEEFSTYWSESKKIDGELTTLADQSARGTAALSQVLRDVEPTNLWAISIGIAKAGGDLQVHLDNFLSLYQGTASLSNNVENRLMSAEILSSLNRTPADALRQANELNGTVRGLWVPRETSLGVASILLSGQRADGRVPVEEFRNYARNTPSYEAAALLALVSRSPDEVLGRFNSAKAIFTSWGYGRSDDTELSAAYLTLTDLPMDSAAPKIAIISKGISSYLQYPLVASSILASIPILEANETLNLLEKAYEILGQRTGPISQAEGLCLAVRLIHGIDVRSLNDLDPTAVKMPAFSYAGAQPRMFLPVLIVHSGYYSTFSSMGGPHPAHIHSWGGGGFGGGFGG